MSARKVHGVVSLCLILAALGVGAFAMFEMSVTQGLFYVALLCMGGVAILYAYCSKCACRMENCGHIIPGFLTRFLPERKPGPYSKLDTLIVAVALGVLLILPLYWVWSAPLKLAAFLALLLLGLVEIRFFVCAKCENNACVINTRSDVKELKP